MSVTIPVGRGDRPQRRAVAPGHRRVAAIDIGSNSIRQIVADVSPDGTIQVVDEMKAAPRLATGLAATGALSDLVDPRGDRSARADGDARQGSSAPSASTPSRRAPCATRRNAAAFLAEVQRVTGLRVRVLDGDEEARLSFRSAVAHFDMGVGRTVVVDIGGGSLELALSAEGVIERLVSLPFGAIRLTEEFFERRRHAEAACASCANAVARRHSRRRCRGATGAARSSSAPAERSPTSRASISRGRESSRRARCTRRTSRAPTSSTSSTCSST